MALLFGLVGLSAQRPIGTRLREAVRVATGDQIQPVGEFLVYNGRPVDLVAGPDGSRLYVKDNRGVAVVDVANWRVVAQVPFDRGGGSMHGITVAPDGRVLATDAANTLYVGQPDSARGVVWTRRVALTEAGSGASYPCGVAVSGDGKSAWVALSRTNSLVQVDLAGGAVTRRVPLEVAPYDVAMAADGRFAWVSEWGGRRPATGQLSAPSAGTPTRVDGRGVATEGTVALVDLAAGRVTTRLETGRHASDLALSGDGRRLFVANANEDTVSVIDTVGRRVELTLDPRLNPNAAYGSLPNALAVSRDGRSLFVANGGDNAVAVFDLGPGTTRLSSRPRGFIPTGWFPGALAVHGDRLLISSIKGMGSRSRALARSLGEQGDPRGKYQVTEHRGTLSSVRLPTTPELDRWTGLLRRELPSARPPASDLPQKDGLPAIEHVVYILKENRTYDQILGDLPQGDGDPSLCLFGRQVTPNHHALAEQFVLLDNFYCNGVVSADGHSWATEGNVTDHLEKSFGGFTRSYTFGDDPLTYSKTGFIWDSVLDRGLSFRNYGEMDYAEPEPAADYFTLLQDWRQATGRFRFRQKIGIERLRRFSAPDYPGWNLAIPDGLRADRFLADLRRFEREGGLPNLLFVYLPQDHTSGSTPGGPTPRAMVADNDLALGRIVEALSRSRFWPRMCVFVVEDDPQDGFDHVDGHRSICLVAGPHVRRGAVIGEFYNQTGVLHTIARLLGLPPLNERVARSPVMTRCFDAQPHPAGYRARPITVPLDERNPSASALQGEARRGALASQNLRLDGPDRIPDGLMNRIVWHAVRGGAAPYPAGLAGAHGRGLARRGVQRETAARIDPDARHEAD